MIALFSFTEVQSGQIGVTMAKLTFEDAVVKAKAVHGDTYKYTGLTREGIYVYLEMVCKDHGAFRQTVSNHVSGKKGCVKCGGKFPHTLETVKEAAAKYEFGYDYLELIRGGKYPKLRMQCASHGEFTMNLYNHLSGKGCEKCGEEEIQTPLEEVRQRILEKMGAKYKLIGEADRNTSDARQFEIECPDHGKWVATLSGIGFGHRCRGCGDIARVEKVRVRIEDVEASVKGTNAEKFKIMGVDLVQLTGKIASVVTAECLEHGQFTRRADMFVKGYGCPVCAGSLGSGTLFDWLRTLKVEVVPEVLLGTGKQRWDFYLPKQKLAIEYNGTLWHSSYYKSSTYHRDKSLASLAVGVRTIHIWEDEWLEKPEIVKNVVKAACGLLTEKMYARKLIVRVADGAQDFLNANHIQGFSRGSNYLGLYQGATLVAVLGYALRDTGRGKGYDSSKCEITRYASSIRVVGGFTKLLKALLKLHPTIKTVATFSDTRIFSGDMYAATGFKEVEKLKPDYFYVQKGRRVHKTALIKGRLTLPEGVPDSCTESERADALGYSRVYDCGKIRWEYTP